MAAVRAGMLGLACTLALPAFGQSAELPAAELPRVLPVWSTDSGRVEALLLIDSTEASSLGLSPLDNLLGTRKQFGVRGRTRLGRNLGLNLDLRPAAPPAMALLCEGNVGLAVGLGRLAAPCVLAQLDDDGRFPLFGTQESVGVSFDWQSGSNELDLSFGLSWLGATTTQSSMAAFNITDPGAPSSYALVNSLGAWQLQGREFSFGGEYWLNPRSWLRIDGRHGSSRLSGPFGDPVLWDSTSLGVSGGYRAFSGQITGRLVEIDYPRQTWSDVDIALSWRTPWDARVTVGARNLLGGAEAAKWPLASLPGLPEAESRTPYVRYQQDL